MGPSVHRTTGGFRDPARAFCAHWFPRGIRVTLILVSGLLVFWALASLRSEALLGGERLTNAYAHVVAEETMWTFQTVDQGLQMAAVGLRSLEAKR